MVHYFDRQNFNYILEIKTIWLIFSIKCYAKNVQIHKVINLKLHTGINKKNTYTSLLNLKSTSYNLIKFI